MNTRQCRGDTDVYGSDNLLNLSLPYPPTGHHLPRLPWQGRDGLDPARLGRLVVGAQNAKRLREAYPDWRAAPEDLEEEGSSLEDGAVVKIEGEAA